MKHESLSLSIDPRDQSHSLHPGEESYQDPFTLIETVRGKGATIYENTSTQPQQINHEGSNSAPHIIKDIVLGGFTVSLQNQVANRRGKIR